MKKRWVKKRLTSLLLILALCLSMMPTAAWAADGEAVLAADDGAAQNTEPVAEVTIGGATTQYTDIKEAFTAAQEADSATVKLLDNVTIPKNDRGDCYGIDLEKGNIVLDLNGKTIKTTECTGFVALNAVFYIGDAKLTVQDSGENGRIEQPNGGQAIGVFNGTLTVENGTIEVISRDTAHDTGQKGGNTQNCAVFVRASGKAIIQGGTLSGNEGVYVQGGILNITGTPMINGYGSYALMAVSAETSDGIQKSTVKLSGGTYTSESDTHSIWNSVGAAAELLADGYRYKAEDGSDAVLSDDETGHGIQGKTVVMFVKDEVSYVDDYWYSDNTFHTTSESNFTYINEATRTLDEGFYVVKGNVNITGDVTATSDQVNIILCDNASLTINGSLLLPKSGSQAGLKIYGQIGSTGSMSVINDTGIALKYSGNNPRVDIANVYVYGGKLSVTGAGQATDNDVWMNAGVKTGGLMMKCTDLVANKPVEYGNITRIGSKTTSFLFERCTEHEWEYDNYSSENDKHAKSCGLCGFDEGYEAHSVSTWTSNGVSGHTGSCICGKEMETTDHDLELTPNADGVTHSQKCSKCDYAAASEAHDFNHRETYESGETYTVCTKCSALLAASCGKVKYASLQRAIDAAKNSSGTVTLEQEVAEHVAVADGEVTIDLNKQKWGRNLSDKTNDYVPLTVTGGRVTLQNGRLHQNGSSSEARMGVVINGGSLIVAGDVSVRGGYDGNIKHSIDLQSGSLTLSKGTTLLTGLKVPDGKKLADYLPTGTAFVKCSYEDGVKIPDADHYEYVTDAYTSNATTESMAVVAHEHSCTAEDAYKCACGFTCTHENFTTDGRCTICGYACPHEASKVSETNGSYTCTACDMQMAVKASKDGVTTYSTDFAAAMNAAEDGTMITLLKNVDNYGEYACIIGDGNIVTLNLAGHTINGGWIQVGIDSDYKKKTSSTLKVTGSGSFITNGNLSVGEKATLDLSGWGGGENDKISRVNLSKSGNEQPNPESLLIVGESTGTIGALGFYNWPSSGVKTKLNGGRYDQVSLTGGVSEQFGSLLAEGYAFRYMDTGNFIEYAKPINNKCNTISNVKVVKCPHSCDATETDGSYRCVYCNTTVTAKVSRGDSIACYATLADALAAATDGDTVTLLAAVTDAENYEIKHAIALDLNGFSIGKVTCTATGVKIQDSGATKGAIGTLTILGGQLKELLPEGYGFKKTDNTWAGEDELNGTTISSVSVKQAPIESLHLTVTKETVVYGYEDADAPTITAAVTFPSESTGTADVTYQWYQVKEDIAEQITDAKASTYQLSTGLDAGTYMFYCIAATDGYAVASENIGVTVEKAEADGTAPQAVESLSYTGSAQNLITAGSTSDGAMQYSLAQNGTYTDTIPTGTDAGTYIVWYQIIGDNNHKDSKPASVKVAIVPMKLSGVVSPEAGTVKKVYDKTNAAELTAVTFLQENSTDTIDVAADDYTISNAHFNDANAGTDKQLIFTVALQSNNYVFAGEDAEGVKEKTFKCATDSSNASYEIAKDAAPANLVNIDVIQKYTVAEGSASDAGAGMPQDAGTLSYAKQSDAVVSKVAHWEVDAVTGEVTYTLSGGAANDTITLPVTIRSTNYNDAAVNIVITLTEKDVPTVTVQDLTVTYDGNPVSAEKIQGTATFGGKHVAGTLEWKNSPAITNVADSGEKTVVFKPQEPENYAEVEKNIYLTINKAAPTGTPKHAAITAGGKKLSDAGLTTEGSTLSVAGTVKWIDKDGNELSQDTGVVRGEAYGWEFTPTDTGNYNKLTGTIILWAKPASTGGGSGGGGAVAPSNPDADVVTVREDTKDNTASEPAAATTTRTTVKDSRTETTKNAQGQDVLKTTASVSKSLGDQLLDQAVANNSHNVEITVPSDTGYSNEADAVKSTELELPKSTVESIVRNTDADLVIKTDTGEVALDNKTLETIANEAKGDTVKISISENTKLTEAQKPAEAIVGDNGRVFDLEAQIGGKLLHDFQGGKAHVTLPMPKTLEGTDILVVYISDKGLCRILNHSIETVGADHCIKFATTHFSTFAVVEKAGAEKLIKEQNQAQAKALMKAAKFKTTTTRTDKKSVKVQITAKSSKTLISDIKSMGYTLRYQFYRSKKKTSGYKLLGTRATNTFTNTKGMKDTRYYYKVRVLVYDDKKLIAKSALGQCSYGARIWNQ